MGEFPDSVVIQEWAPTDFHVEKTIFDRVVENKSAHDHLGVFLEEEESSFISIAYSPHNINRLGAKGWYRNCIIDARILGVKLTLTPRAARSKKNLTRQTTFDI